MEFDKPLGQLDNLVEGQGFGKGKKHLITLAHDRLRPGYLLTYPCPERKACAVWRRAEPGKEKGAGEGSRIDRKSHLPGLRGHDLTRIRAAFKFL